MAVGDAITAIVSVPAGGSVTYQPAAGVEVMIVATQVSDINTYFYITDGTNDIVLNPSQNVYGVGRVASGASGEYRVGAERVFITNSIYLKIVNYNTANAYNAAYSGIQTK